MKFQWWWYYDNFCGYNFLKKSLWKNHFYLVKVKYMYGWNSYLNKKHIIIYLVENDVACKMIKNNINLFFILHCTINGPHIEINNNYG
jgi:hypothetical protein